MSVPQPARALLSDAELRAAIEALSDADFIRLGKIAAAYAAGLPVEPEDLLQKALRRALDGTRSCPRDVPVLVFLTGAMKSIASSERGKSASDPLFRAGDIPLSQTSGAPDPETALSAAQDQAEAARQVNAVLDLFRDDQPAQLVLMGEMEGLSADDIRAMGEMNKTTYASVRRRIRRKIEREQAQGWKP